MRRPSLHKIDEDRSVNQLLAASSKPQDQEMQSPKARPGARQTPAEAKLRNTYLAQSERGEEHYNDGKYSLAAACFNDAKFALLMIKGMPGRRSGRDGANVATIADMRDQINSVSCQTWCSAQGSDELRMNLRDLVDHRLLVGGFTCVMRRTVSEET